MKKAFEYSKMCDADVCVGIRLRETGQVHILTADDSGFWAFIASQLVCYKLLTMARSSAGQSKAYSVAKSLRQKRDRRKISLEKKSHEYSNKCGADVCLGIRIRESGKVFIFFADTSGFWSFLGPHLGAYYPTPVQRTEKNL
ncbi:hypothetical protein N7533_008286 [Penicillium manginii]|uniref:uncharacterized protein n=1 Tax=Penicillium manginii TaxID=203109 RepID=UPI002549A8F5|nr:uncharacterized protein N7533_008286 [Penicillium manginii]KAJ5751258.1 hypothetical protein N7533_008286 [Penicillium manginii]